MSFFTRLQGVFFSPQQTFRAIAEKPVWLDALVALLILVAFFSYLVTPFSISDRADALRDNVKLKEQLGEESFNQKIEQMENPSSTLIILSSFVLSPISTAVGFLLSSLIIMAIARLFSTEGKYIQVFSVLLHANFIDKFLGNGVRLFLVLSRKSVMQTTTSLALLFPRLEATSLSFMVLTQIDFFQLWLFGILGYGLSYIFKIDLKKALIISYSFWLLKSLFYIGLAVLSVKLVS
ncbi:MAG: YIP1 family protein [Candidatus Aminicenantes bacterium]